MADDAPITTINKKKRSPAYPALALERAVQFARTLREQFDEHSAPIESAAEAWEISATSSGVLQVISALKQFGLLADEGSKDQRQLRLTDLALDILAEEDGSEDRLAMIREAALTPKIYRELWHKFGPSLPPNDGPLRVYLTRQREDGTFNRLYVDGLIGDFRETIAYASLPDEGAMDEESSSSSSSDSSTSSSMSSSSTSSLSSVSSMAGGGVTSRSYSPAPAMPATGKPANDSLRLPITLPSLKVAWLEVPSQLTAVEFATIKASLEMFKDALVVTAPPASASTSASVGRVEITEPLLPPASQ